MSKVVSEPAVKVAAEELRNFILDLQQGAFLGSEDALRLKLGCSRNTLRQAARLLERDGYIMVRRGLNGGYFAARPSINQVQDVVAAYLETLDMDAEDVTEVASALWAVVMRKAAAAMNDDARPVLEKLQKRLKSIKADATFTEIRKFEQESRRVIFDLAKCRYVELIFNINTTFASRNFPPRWDIDDTSEHLDFVKAWRPAKAMELASIYEGDTQLAAMAARHVREIWHKRVWQPGFISAPASAEAAE